MTESVGSKLKNLRLQKGLSLQEAHKKTKIHLNILEAIEEDRLINFSPVYIKGFIKIYCKFLGVDPRDYIPDYKEPKAKIIYVSDLSRKPVVSFKMPSLKKLSFLKGIRIKPRVMVRVILILIFVIALFNLGKFISSHTHRLSRGAQLPNLASSQPENKASRGRAETSPLVLKIITLDIHAKENCFIQVKADNRVLFHNILKKGRSESWQAKDKIELSLGNAGAVELEVNGKRISGLGRKGQALKNILITKEGLSIK